MTAFYTHDEIATEAGFIAVVARFPKPIPAELLPVYRRLRAFGLRRGWSWPYRNYVPDEKRATGVAEVVPITIPTIPEPVPVDLETRGRLHQYFTPQFEYSRWRHEGRDECWRAERASSFKAAGPFKGERHPQDCMGDWDTYHALRAELQAKARLSGHSHGRIRAEDDQEYFWCLDGQIHVAPLAHGFDDDGFRYPSEAIDVGYARRLGLLPDGDTIAVDPVATLRQHLGLR